MKRPRTWILLADGGSARLVRQLRPDPETGERLEDISLSHEEKPLRQIMSDRPGRSFSSTSRHRSAMEYGSDPVRDGHRQFAARIVEELSQHRAAGSFDRLILIAEPRMLGLLRDELDEPLRAMIADEIDKDLIKLPREKLIEVVAASTLVRT